MKKPTSKKQVATLPEVRKIVDKWKRQDRREDDKKYERKDKGKCK